MKIVSRLLSFFLILQLLALSTIPPVRIEFPIHGDQAYLNSAKETQDESGFLGQFSGFNKEEQTEISEDDTESIGTFQGLACDIRQFLQPGKVFLNKCNDLSDTPPGYVKKSLFLLFHCWKIDLFEV
ncbi:MAG: hypothetical protein LW630_00740 [Saprospiraceae bacterium]|jgi:hypothetical protein|nr:hypothetical protein [Saprospiraceae bacterium]